MGVDSLDDLSHHRHDGWVAKVCWISRCRVRHDGGRREREDGRRVTGDEEAEARGWRRKPKRLGADCETDESSNGGALRQDGSGVVAELRRISAPAETNCSQASEHESKEQGHERRVRGSRPPDEEGLSWNSKFNQSNNNPLSF